MATLIEQKLCLDHPLGFVRVSVRLSTPSSEVVHNLMYQTLKQASDLAEEHVASLIEAEDRRHTVSLELARPIYHGARVLSLFGFTPVDRSVFVKAPSMLAGPHFRAEPQVRLSLVDRVSDPFSPAFEKMLKHSELFFRVCSRGCPYQVVSGETTTQAVARHLLEHVRRLADHAKVLNQRKATIRSLGVSL